jgi:tripartite-type tricarboxylate transporter receptor subunit TctC
LLPSQQPRSTSSAEAADYPAGPITLIVPYPAGGGNDVIARLVAAKMTASRSNLHRESPANVRFGSKAGVRFTPKSGRPGVFIQGTSFILLNPDPDQLA